MIYKPGPIPLFQNNLTLQNLVEITKPKKGVFLGKASPVWEACNLRIGVDIYSNWE